MKLPEGWWKGAKLMCHTSARADILFTTLNGFTLHPLIEMRGEAFGLTDSIVALKVQVIAIQNVVTGVEHVRQVSTDYHPMEDTFLEQPRQSFPLRCHSTIAILELQNHIHMRLQMQPANISCQKHKVKSYFNHELRSTDIWISSTL